MASTPEALLAAALASKETRRQELAKLPYAEKIRMALELGEIASALKAARAAPAARATRAELDRSK
jgi:hypothetical protein